MTATEEKTHRLRPYPSYKDSGWSGSGRFLRAGKSLTVGSCLRTATLGPQTTQNNWQQPKNTELFHSQNSWRTKE